MKNFLSTEQIKNCFMYKLTTLAGGALFLVPVFQNGIKLYQLCWSISNNFSCIGPMKELLEADIVDVIISSASDWRINFLYIGGTILILLGNLRKFRD